jgi:hypothetical protein
VTAEEAMARSAKRNETVTLDAYSAMAHETLFEACDHHVSVNGLYEFWAHVKFGADEFCKVHNVSRSLCDDAHTEMAWRVHMPWPNGAPF